MDQKIEELSAEDAADLEAQRSWVRDHFEPEARHHYETLDGKLRLLETILTNGWIKLDETWKLQSLGATLGDAIKQRLGLIWVAVEDEYGRDAALQVPQTTVLIFPLTMISKRIESGDALDIAEFFDDLCDMIDDMKNNHGFKSN
ncbi:DUF3806 domain-containing protein [Asticcacaulis sp. ZE23SCel15]|uniref:DUF3806 domain-containing protein n=1 Tax=Asticcacaulis sp. ZE23SCel15 TaxID=3059027 RepID=UPI00265F1717|nr:DUF3806 domain-containing protein [Asticcacaulis sp. ZE23SCel15]WKL57405.1 DUF3806 domain-containing protein [Asticcacaulis sp. ZE23SCel15]